MATIARNGSTLVVATVTHLIAVLGQPVLRDETAIIGHQETGVNVERRVGTGELTRRCGQSGET